MKKMKISTLLSIRWILLYSILATTEITALCYDMDGICSSNASVVKREVNVDVVINPCEWIEHCKIQCFSDGYIYNASINVQSMYDTNETCHSSGIALILHRVSTYNLQPNWFSADISLIELELSNIYRIEENPFRAEVFSKVENLTLKSLCPCELKKFTLTGLHSLNTLTMPNIQFDNISNIEMGVLEFVKDTLNRFELIERNQYNNEISINHFIGDSSAEMSNMKYVKIRYNLGTINQLSFTAIPNVKELDLSDCQITNIAEFTFNSLRGNLQILNLERNMLVTLSVGTFTNLNLSPTTDEPFLKIHLSGNPWDCDCGVEHLRQLLVEYSNFDCPNLCDTPERIRLYPIKPSELCPDPPNTTITTSTSTSTTTTTTTPTTTTLTTTQPTTSTSMTDENTSTTYGTTDFVTDFTEKQCFSSNSYEVKANVLIKRQVYQIHMIVTSDEISVLIESDELNLALIWFSTVTVPNNFPNSYHRSSTIDCVSASQKKIDLKNLHRETAYTICLIHMIDSTVSPLDCISYYHYGAEINGVWLLQSIKPLVIGVIVGGLVTTIIISMMIGSAFWRYNQYDSFSGKNQSVSVRMALHSTNNNTLSIQETNYTNLVNDSNHSNSLEERLDNPPPLPPHPKRLEIEDNEDNYYATIKY